MFFSFTNLNIIFWKVFIQIDRSHVFTVIQINDSLKSCYQILKTKNLSKIFKQNFDYQKIKQKKSNYLKRLSLFQVFAFKNLKTLFQELRTTIFFLNHTSKFVVWYCHFHVFHFLHFRWWEKHHIFCIK